eukprot:TRINITY_DN30031_c0_g1_i1.p2 TRINITY_DN30031_c0_g1~~TRINITY_DN30031_c0_g1_i1.p2  ORF type:complete len:342 (+),score=125.30 TRINITY_DN30031_c0_g1_i1:35-1060(+)
MEVRPDKKKVKAKKKRPVEGGTAESSGAGAPPPPPAPAEVDMEAFGAYAVRGCAGGMVDIGANIAKLMGKDLSRMLQRGAAAGVGKVIITGTSEKISLAAQKTAQQETARGSTSGVRLFFTAGVHPHDAKSWTGETEAAMRALMKDPLCVAAGEMGLDYDRMFSPREVQLEVLAAQLRLAAETQLPLFLHERDRGVDRGAALGSHKDLVAALDAARVPPARVCVHCFTASEADLRDYIARGYFIGITGFIAMGKRGAALRAAITAGALPLSRLMIETDAPYMKPDGVPPALGVVGRQNEPCTLPTTVRALAECYGLPEGDVAAAVTRNTLAFFPRLGGGGE